MYIDTTYFKNDIYLPHSNPSITDDVEQISTSLQDFINEHVKDCILKLLGRDMALDFFNATDFSETPAQIKAGDEFDIWRNLLNGEPKSETLPFEWKGMRYSSKAYVYDENSVADKSLLAYYTYFFYEQSSHLKRTNIGNVLLEGDGGIRVDGNPKAVRAWRKFYELAYGKSISPHIADKRIGNDFYNVGLDWSKGQKDTETSLKEYIDYKILNDGIFKNYKPVYLNNMNHLNL